MNPGQMTTVPPRAETNAQIPTPQTTMGVLSDFGALSDLENISDVVPDFSWMTSMEIYKQSFIWSVNDDPGKELIKIYPSSKINAGDARSDIWAITAVPCDWHFIPFTASRWWSGFPTIRLMAIKPPRVTGKLLVVWYPDLHWLDEAPDDTLQRSIKYEWDLGESSEYSLKLSGYNITRLRPTWLNLAYGASNAVTSQYRDSVSQAPPLQQCTFGVLKVTVQNSLQPGSIFPDSIRILIFQSFTDSTFSTSTDLRGSRPHFFGVTRSPYIERHE